MFFHARAHTKRRICGVMVLVWVFAVFSSVVNACLVSAPERAGTELAALLAHDADHGADHDDDHAGHDSLAAHEEADHGLLDDHSHDGDGQAGCKKFCKDENATLTKNKGLDAFDFSHVLVNVSAKLMPYAPAAQVAQRLRERPLAHGPPIVIRFLRLTL